MEFEFRRDVSGELQARFSMGSEAFGRWLQDEVGHNSAVLIDIFRAIEELRSEERKTYQRSGSEYTIKLTLDEVEVFDTRVDFDAQELMDETAAADALDFYDEESHACCGLDDFEEMLLEWKLFLSV